MFNPGSWVVGFFGSDMVWGGVLLINFLILTSGLSLTLDQAIKNAKGVYKQIDKQIGFENTVIVTAGNYGYLNHLHNFKCFADRIGIKFLTFSFDQQGIDYLDQHPDMNGVHLDLQLKGGTHTFREGEFNRISMGKMKGVYEVLKLGYNVIFIDPDVVLVHDPFFIFNRSDMDYIHSVNVRCQGDMPKWTFDNERFEHNTGFYYLRSRPFTITFLKKFLGSVNMTKPWLDDQSLFWKYLRNNHNSLRVHSQECRNVPIDKFHSSSSSLPGPILRLCHLDQCQFPAGGIGNYDHIMTVLAGKPLYTLHANYLHGNQEKYQKLQEKGYWIATQKRGGGGGEDGVVTWDGPCQAFSYPPKQTLQPIMSPIIESHSTGRDRYQGKGRNRVDIRR